jgi:hypothetical protein
MSTSSIVNIDDDITYILKLKLKNPNNKNKKNSAKHYRDRKKKIFNLMYIHIEELHKLIHNNKIINKKIINEYNIQKNNI